MAQYICSFIKKCLFCFFTNNNEQYEPVHSFRNDDYEVEKLLSGSEAPSVHWLANKSVAKKSSILEMTPIDDSFNASNFSNFSDSSSSSDARMQFGASQDMQLYHDGSNSFIDNNVGALRIATATSGIAVTIGHTTSETTIADNLTVTGTSNLVGTLSLNGTAITKTAAQINSSATTGLAVAVAVAL